jgi:hypothetical protein
MKTKKLASVLIAFLLPVLPLLAQNEYAFKVLVNKGKNEVKAGESWHNVKVGTSLKSTDELKVTENSYVGLVHVSGKPLELKKAGKYKVADLAGKIGGGTSVLNKYTDFILSTNTTKKNNLAATGAVHRGADFPLYLPVKDQNPRVYNDEIIISWDAEKVAGPYVVYLRSLFEDELQKVETKDNKIKVNLADNTLAAEENIVVMVVTKANANKKSDQYTLKRVSKVEKEKIGNSLNEISGQISEPTALNKLVLAGFFEQNGLLIDATTAHLQAIELAPDVPAFKDSFNEFLVRNGLKAAPQK